LKVYTGIVDGALPILINLNFLFGSARTLNKLAIPAYSSLLSAGH